MTLRRVILAVAILACLALGLPVGVLAASPAPVATPGSDTRSAGQGPGLVGDPGLAILAVVGVAAVAIILTLAYVRVTGGPGQRSDGAGRTG